jgi:hypothetical protein
LSYNQHFVPQQFDRQKPFLCKPHFTCNCTYVCVYIVKSSFSCPGGVNSGHRIRLGNRRPGFESRTGYMVFRKIIAMLLCIIDLVCIVCLFTWEIKAFDTTFWTLFFTSVGIPNSGRTNLRLS